MRPSRQEALIATAFVWAKRSTCARMSVGAVIHRNGRILVQGYNGAPSGLPHCDQPHEPHECRAVHAEQNAIAFAARHGVEIEGADIVITHQPCLSCARSIINSGIRSVTYVHPYRLIEGVLLLREAGLQVEEYLDWEEPRLIDLVGDETE